MKTRNRNTITFFLCLCCYSTYSNALVFQGSDVTSYWYFGAGTSMDINYDATSNEFSLFQEGTFGIRSDTGTLDVFDGAFDLAATIDEMGVMSSGEFSITGGNTSLGILDDTLLMHATLQDFRHVNDDSNRIDNLTYADSMPLFQFISYTDSLLPALNATEYMDLRIHASRPSLNLFQNDFSLHPYTGTTLTGTIVNVPEPAGMSLILMGLIWLYRKEKIKFSIQTKIDN